MSNDKIIPFGRTHNPDLDGLEEAMGFGQFTCPKCGSHFFNSGTWGGVETGYCKGRWVNHVVRYTGCEFKWNRPDEDESVGLTKPDHPVRFVIDENHCGHIVHDDKPE